MPGYIIGCTELIEYTLYISVSNYSLACLICYIFELKDDFVDSVSQLAYPLNNWFKLMFGVKDEHSKYLGILSIPAVYATAFGFVIVKYLKLFI